MAFRKVLFGTAIITAVGATLAAAQIFATENTSAASQQSVDPRVGARNNGFVQRDRHLLYVTLPGSGVYPSWRNGLGIVVLDADDQFAFVKRIPVVTVPASGSPEHVAGVTASIETNMIYLAYRGRLAAVDLATDQVVWVNAYDGKCCERPQVTADGKTILVGADVKDFWYVIDAKTGKLKGKIQAPLSVNSHNMNLSPDGKTAFMAPNGPILSVGDVAAMKTVKTIQFTDNVRPFVVNHDGTQLFANTNNLLGFEVADVSTGRIIKHIEAPAYMWKDKWFSPTNKKEGHGCPSHGIALTPDEREVWVVDNINSQMLIFDNTKNTPDLVETFKTTKPAYWITVSIDGKLAFLSSGDIVDIKSRKIIGQMNDEYSRAMYSEKVLDMIFSDMRLTAVSNQFGNGIESAVKANLASGTRKEP
jgi:DNA-binding beta-propeller fold protein YncE